MSWKSIELQVALPRTQDAGKIQEQMSKQNQHFQESLAMNQLRQDELKRTRVNEMDQVDQTAIHDEDDTKDGKEQTEKEKEESQKKKKEIKHPYLGSHIDLNG